MTVIPLHVKAIVNTRGDANDHLQVRGDAVLVQRDTPRWMIMACPCGCGEIIPINLDVRSGPAWELYDGKTDGLSVFPSIWRDTGCKSHFIVWYGRIWLFDGSGEVGPNIPEAVLQPLFGDVQKMLSTEPVHFREIAKILGAVPWDVQYVCRQLVGAGYAEEGRDRQKGFFALTSSRE